MSSYEFGGLVSFTLAIILLFLGKTLTGRIEILRRYSIPEPVIGNARNLILKKDEAYPGAKLGIALISDISLGMFLTMALMGLELWELQGLVLFITVVMVFQILLSILFTLFIVFRFMGKDYEASVISAGFGGISLGSTATAIVNMTAVAKQYGAAHRAFIIVPLVCGFFIDLVNAFIINFFV
jgi:ESS family glutamate:Na+ symporter